jgi:hypothetical protein
MDKGGVFTGGSTKMENSEFFTQRSERMDKGGVFTGGSTKMENSEFFTQRGKRMVWNRI